MSSTKRFGLSQLATQNVKCRGGLGSACSLYRYNYSMDRLMSTSNKNNNNDNNESNKSCGHLNEWTNQRHNGQQNGHNRLTNLIGVKKTFVNRMQGMIQNSRQKNNRIQPMVHSLNPNRYSIYGPTKIFSAISRINKSSDLGLMNPPQRNFSSLMGVSYNVHQRYEPINSQRSEDVAKDISRSIQSELMEVNPKTKDLISCVRSKYDNSSEYGATEKEQTQQFRQSYFSPKMSFDPLDGWKHPTAIKPVDLISLNALLETQHKPLRRKSASIRYKGDLKEFVSSKQKQLKQPILQSRRSSSQLGETYVKSAKQRTLRQTESLGDNSDKLMSRQPNSSSNAPSDLMDLHDDRRSKNEDFIADESRMDNARYPSKTASNLMSASQRLINNRTDGARKLANSRDMAMEVMLVKNAAQHITSSAMPSLQPIPKVRPVSMFRLDSLKGLKKKVSNKLLTRHSDQINLPDNVPNNSGTLSAWKQGKKSENLDTLTYVGEKRPSEISNEDVRNKDSQSQEKLQNTIPMPNEYTKQSAVQRIGSITKRNPVHKIYLQQRGRI